jgi:hypothetical protein
MWSMKTSLRALAFLLAAAAAAPAKDYDLYYLGGQSNMDGFGFVKELPEELNAPVAGVMIFHGNMAADGAEVDGRGLWAPLRPGNGTGFKSDGRANTYSDRFGVELTFGRRMKELYPDRNIAILKYSRGGTSIAVEAAGNFGCWEPDYKKKNGVNQWDHFLAALKGATSVKDIDGDGEPDRLIPRGIVWMQGESDAQFDEETAKRYRENLRRLMDLIRAALREDDLRVAIGRISSSEDAPRKPAKPMRWKHGPIVREAQAAWVEADGHAALVTSTDGYGYSDPWHYDSAGYVDLGRRFAEALKVP